MLVAILVFALADDDGVGENSGVELVAVQRGAEEEPSDASPLRVDQGRATTAVAAVPIDVPPLNPRLTDAGPTDASMAALTPPPQRDEPVRKKAKLTIRVKPWAHIWIDGKDYGQTPQTIELDRGKHRIVLKNVGLDRVERSAVTLRAGQTKSIDKNWMEN